MSFKILRNIEMELNTKSINNAIRQINEVKQELVDAMNDLIRKLTDEGVKIAKMQVASMDAVDTGELEHSIFGYFDPESRIGYIVAGAPHAFYVEYGTGPVGEENPHPEAGEIGWEYNIGPTIHKNGSWGVGWWYPGDDGKAHWTRGQPARPFMLNTMQWLEEAAQTFASKEWAQM